MNETLSDKITKCGLCDKNFQPFLRVEDVKEAVKEILWHRKCLNCKLNICNCGKEEWVVDINVIKEEVGEKLI